MVELDDDAVDDALEELESGMESAERAHSHDEIRPSTIMMGKSLKDAYRALVGAHPGYDLDDGGDDR